MRFVPLPVLNGLLLALRATRAPASPGLKALPMCVIQQEPHRRQCRVGQASSKPTTQTGSGVPKSLEVLVMLRHVRRTETLIDRIHTLEAWNSGAKVYPYDKTKWSFNRCGI